MDTDTLPAGGQHPYAAQLDALEGVLCVDTIAAALGTARVGTVLELSVLLERYRVTLLEPVGRCCAWKRKVKRIDCCGWSRPYPGTAVKHSAGLACSQNRRNSVVDGRGMGTLSDACKNW